MFMPIIPPITFDIPKDYVLSYRGANISGTTAIDDAGNYDGTLVNGVTTRTGPDGVNNAFSFDGTNDYINTGYKTNGGDYTISAWIYHDTNNTQDAVYAEVNASNNSYGAYLNTLDGIIYAGHYNGLGSSPGNNNVIIEEPSPGTGVWYHIALVRKNNDVNELYVDGLLVGTESTGNNTTASSFTGKIGGNPDYTGGGGGTLRAFDGGIDLFRIYDRALSAGEIGRLANEVS